LEEATKSRAELQEVVWKWWLDFAFASMMYQVWPADMRCEQNHGINQQKGIWIPHRIINNVTLRWPKCIVFVQIGV
jgi:hypothetical protein